MQDVQLSVKKMVNQNKRIVSHRILLKYNQLKQQMMGFVYFSMNCMHLKNYVKLSLQRKVKKKLTFSNFSQPQIASSSIFVTEEGIIISVKKPYLNIP